MFIRGRVHKLGEDINTDDIIAAKYLDSQDARFLGSKCMENIIPGFAQGVKKGDVIVAGRNFGCGSSREHAPLAIKGCRVDLVIAKSFARIFFRNAINIGLPIIELKETDNISEGSLLEVNLAKGVVKDKTAGCAYQTSYFPFFLQEIIEAGGLIDWIKRKNNLSK